VRYSPLQQALQLFGLFRDLKAEAVTASKPNPKTGKTPEKEGLEGATCPAATQLPSDRPKGQ